MEIRKLSAALGAEVVGADLRRPLAKADFARVREAFLDHSVLVFRGQDLTPAQLVTFSEQWGPSESYRATLGDIVMKDHPVIVLSNIIENGKPLGGQDAGRYWHTDGSYVRKPAWFSALYAREVPRGDDGRPLGDTRFASMAAALEALPREDQERLSRLTALHKYVYRYTRRDTQLEGVSHPMILTHPVTGRRGIYVNAGFTDSVEGLPEEEGRKLLGRIYEHVEHPDFGYRHRWAVGDVVMWDNYITQHRATGDFGPDRRRLMWRTTIQGFDLGQPPRRDRVPEASSIDQRDPRQVAAAAGAA
ncbi:MAG: TauD/TfdA dioxygenase family protein [Lautropia sp.]